MYGYKTKYTSRLSWLFGILRFITLFSLLLLLINPKFKSVTYQNVRPKMPILVDNSASIKELKQTENLLSIVESLKANQSLNDKFDLSFFSFGSEFNMADSLTFNESNTNISKALSSANDLFKNDVAPTILLTDGNQTLGNDYEFSVTNSYNPLFPIILGDSISHTDFKIEHLNTNRYVFLKNQFPVEVILGYYGHSSENSQFIVRQGTNIVYKENVKFSKVKNVVTLEFTLPASAVGLQKYSAEILPLNDEKNIVNNTKQFAVEVIDQATNVLIVSDITHPDLGALKKSIGSNEQSTVTIKKPSEAASSLNEYQLIILYQPDRSFAKVFSEVEKLKKNTFVFTGLQTDWNFLNSIQKNYSKDVSRQFEVVTGILNPNYGTFAIEEIGFEEFRPLKTLFGNLKILVPNELLLDQIINGINTESPMLSTMELNGVRNAIFDGEGIWKWRAQSFVETNSFEEFDNFIGKLIQYLASNKRHSRLEVSDELFYYNNNSIKISAQYFDQNFIFDSRASLSITVQNIETKKSFIFPMLLKNNFFEVDLNTLSSGEYKYTVSVSNETVARSGNFTILDFNIEQQFLNANVAKLERLATNARGTAYFENQVNGFITDMLEDNRFKQIQKSEQKVVPLIDWKYLLALIIISLTIEWFIRKYNGLI